MQTLICNVDRVILVNIFLTYQLCDDKIPEEKRESQKPPLQLISTLNHGKSKRSNWNYPHWKLEVAMSQQTWIVIEQEWSWDLLKGCLLVCSLLFKISKTRFYENSMTRNRKISTTAKYFLYSWAFTGIWSSYIYLIQSLM